MYLVIPSKNIVYFQNQRTTIIVLQKRHPTPVSVVIILWIYIYEVKRKSSVLIYIYYNKALKGQNCSYAAFIKAYHNFRAVLLIIISY